MSGNKVVYIVGVIVLVAVIGIGIYSQSKPTTKTGQNVAVDSSGGSLKVTEIPVEPPTPSPTETKTEPINTTTDNQNMNKATIETSMGKIVLELYPKDAPKTVENFITLVKKGFYNGVIFHRVINGFMIQGGDPTGTGMGGPGYKFADELNPSTPSYQTGYKKGVLAMANAGPNTNGSQFFIMLADNALPHAYTIFGHVISGQDVVDAIGKTPTDANDRPLTPVVMKSVTVSD